MRCKPGDMCLVIGEMPGCECNIGAILTVTKPTSGFAENDSWEFKDANRPLKVVNLYGRDDAKWVTNTFEGGCYACVFDHHLMPIKPEADDESTEEMTEDSIVTN